jgi:tRNA(adenine34) deaminase
MSVSFPYALTPMTLDEKFMLEALKEAWKAYQNGEVPVGAVVVSEERIIARANNQIEALQDATAHAEMVCLTAAENALSNWRLTGATLYCTLEPCLMCVGAMLLTRIERLVYGAKDVRHGALGSWMNILEYKHPMHTLLVTPGVFGEASSDMMKKFFQERRKSEKEE